MPIHDRSRVEAILFYNLQLSWNCELSAWFNKGDLPAGYHSLIEHHKAAFGFEIPTIGRSGTGEELSNDDPRSRRYEKLLREPWPDPPVTQIVAEDDLERYRRGHRTVTIRHEIDDEVVAVVEIIAPADKHSRRAVRLLVEKVANLLDRNIQVLLIDICPPGKFDRRGSHGAIWEEITGQDYVPPPGKPLTLAAYECQDTLRAHVEALAIGDRLPKMPLFLGLGRSVMVPLDATYQTAWMSIPHVLRDRIEGNL